jgi:hypothetical protein
MWPVPAVLAWISAWAVFVFVRLVVETFEWSQVWAVLAGVATGAVWTLLVASRWRRLIVLGGFPLSVVLVAGSDVPAWTWALAAVPLWLLYPKGAWRDAPLYPTPGNALEGLAWGWPGDPPRRILDAGCGLGHGLSALHEQWPRAELHGIEWSGMWAWLARRRCPFATITRGDMWAADWSAYDLVYVFQRPESMEHAWDKANAEMRPGTWLVSLEFNVPADIRRVPDYQLQSRPGKPVLAWRMGPASIADSGRR